MPEEHLILEHLAYISSRQRTVTLITNFRGVPIQLSAIVIRSSQNGGNVRLCVTQRQIISLKIANQALVQSELFSEMVMANIDQVDMHTNLVTLSHLRYVTGSMGKRKNVRVQPENPIHAEIISQHGFSLLGEVIDISLDGLSVLLSKDNLPTEEMLAPQTPVEVRYSLPGCKENAIHDLTVQAKIAYTQSDSLTCRMGLITFLDEAEIQTVMRYIFDRQTEILDEIQRMNHSYLKVAALPGPA